MLKLTYISHSAFILSDGRYTIAIDPFITGNPTATMQISDLPHIDYIFITHAHSDHIGDALKIAKLHNSIVICVDELANYLAKYEIRTHSMHIGGKRKFPFGALKIVFAQHGSKLGTEYMGNPAGVVINIGGKALYHCGDTGLFLDMKLIGEICCPDVMLVPIGGNFTMDIEDAIRAVEFVNPKLSIPMHYNTFPVIEANPNEFVSGVNKIGKKALIMEYGQTIEL